MQKNTTSCLVTGGTGFIGAYIVRDLVREGMNVILYDVSPQTALLEQLLGKDLKNKITIVRGDVLDLALLINTANEHKVSQIVHMAALLLSASSANPLLALRVNCEGTVNIFETARILGLKKLVWASSGAVFGPPEKYHQGYLPNDAPHYPGSLYGACKSFNEKAAELYLDKYGVDSIAIRFGGVYGAGQREGVSAALTQELIINPALGKPGKVPYADDIINWLYVEDAARSAVLALQAPQTKTRAFNVAGDFKSIREVADYVRQLFPDSEITLEPGTMGVAWKVDASCIEREIGFRPEWPVERAVKKIANSVRKQNNLPPI